MNPQQKIILLQTCGPPLSYWKPSSQEYYHPKKSFPGMLKLLNQEFTFLNTSLGSWEGRQTLLTQWHQEPRWRNKNENSLQQYTWMTFASYYKTSVSTRFLKFALLQVSEALILSASSRRWHSKRYILHLIATKYLWPLTRDPTRCLKEERVAEVEGEGEAKALQWPSRLHLESRAPQPSPMGVQCQQTALPAVPRELLPGTASDTERQFDWETTTEHNYRLECTPRSL